MTNVFNIIKNQIFIVLPVFKKYYIPIEMLDDIDIFFAWKKNADTLEMIWWVSNVVMGIVYYL